MEVLLIGGSGFIGKYCVNNLLAHGHNVTNIDVVEYKPLINLDKYTYFKKDIKDEILYAFENKEVVINFAALLGGINYFHKYPAKLLLENELICASVFEQSYSAYKKGLLKKIIQLSSSMVFENVNVYPSLESDLHFIPSPSSVYGFQKLMCEYWCKAYNEEYGLPYIIVRPFNAMGIGEDPSKDSHVIPQLIYKVLKGQYPLELIGNGSQIRVYTHAADIAEAIRLIIESDIKNIDFNISNEKNQITVLELAKLIWSKICPEKEFKYVELPDLKYDVQKRIGSSVRIKELLNWEPKILLDNALDEIIEDMKKWVK